MTVVRVKHIFSLMMAVVCLMGVASSAQAHGVFKKQMDAKYPGKKVTCNACHIDKAPKTDRNSFGKVFAKMLEEKKLTEQWKDKKGAEKKEFETDVMGPAFLEALEKVQKMTYNDMVEAGLVDGITIEAEEK